MIIVSEEYLLAIEYNHIVAILPKRTCGPSFPCMPEELRFLN